MSEYECWNSSNGSILSYCQKRIDHFKSIGIKTNVNYTNFYKAYIKWYEKALEKPGFTMVEAPTNLITGTVFISQHNVDQYYKYEVCNNCTNSQQTVKKKIAALSWYLTHIEDTESLPIVCSTVVNSALVKQHANYVSHSHVANAGTDPHKGLKDVLCKEEEDRLVHTMWIQNNDSLDLIFAYTWGRNAAVRGHSTRALKFCDLNVSRGFGPELDPPRDRTLLLVLRKGETHKDRYTTDRQVGCQRHRNFRHCSVFSTGALLIMNLRSLGKKINFLRENPSTRALWWDFQLSEYNTYSQESVRMLKVFKTATVDHNGKPTHFRTQAVQYGGSRGLEPYQICTYKKHITDKFHLSYQPEVDEEALKVMSGFRKLDTRFVKEEHVVFPGNHEEYLNVAIEFFIPEYRRFVREQESKEGDKSTCAGKFLQIIIPFLVETVLQNGIYFIKFYPDHLLSRLLKVSLFRTVFGYFQYLS